MAEGSLPDFMDLLVALEETIAPGEIRVWDWRPTVMVETPSIYNWMLPSPSEIPATQTIVDTMNIAVRLVVKPADLRQESRSAAAYFDLIRDTLDADLIAPSKSSLRTACHSAKRTTSRTLTDFFGDQPYMALELVVEAKFRRMFQPT